MKDLEFQREQVKKLRSQKLTYEEASIYTVLLDLLLTTKYRYLEKLFLLNGSS